MNMDPEDLRLKVTDRTKLIIPVPMSGGWARIGRIMEVVREINRDRLTRGIIPLRVMEDDAQSIGAFSFGIPGSIEPIGIVKYILQALFNL